MKFDRVLLIVAAIAIAAYARFLFHNLSYAAGGPDTGGYMNEARLIASGHVARPVDLVRILGLDDSWLGFFMPLGFAPSRHASMHPLYPPGLPFHLAAAGLVGGWKRAPYFIAPLAAIGCVILMIAVARRLGIPLILSFAGAIAVAALPPFLWHAVQPASDVLAMFWALLALWLALKIDEDHPAFAFATGIAFAIGIWVRPTNALMLIPIALAVRLRWRALVSIAIGAFPLIVALMIWNAKLYGSPFRTGYGAIDLSWEGVLNAAPQHAEWLSRMLTMIVFPCGLLVIFDSRRDGWTRWMLALWFIAYFVFYSFYGFFDGWLCLRFLLPAIPALLYGVLLMMRDIVEASRRMWQWATAVMVVAALSVWICVTPMKSTRKVAILPVLPHLETGYPRQIRWAEGRLPKRALVVTGVLSGAFLYYSHRSIARYDQLDDSRFQLLRAYAGNAGLPWFAVVSDEEINVAGLRQRFRGDWKIVDHVDDVTIYRLAE